MTNIFHQGGYLEGKLRLPKEGSDGLRIVISTRPDRCTATSYKAKIINIRLDETFWSDWYTCCTGTRESYVSHAQSPGLGEFI